ncbi:MAG: hypothetical protein LH473_07935 [Chitinophagales bacterium]|nr:hypothetical protein [Chitinophagales bacterium]
MKYSLLIVALLITFSGRAQNIVPNPSFEDTISCPTVLGDNKSKTLVELWRDT